MSEEAPKAKPKRVRTGESKRKQAEAHARWCKRNKEKRRAYKLKWIEKNRAHVKKYNQEYYARTAQRAPSVPMGTRLAAALAKLPPYVAAQAAVSRSIPQDVRDDIISEITLAVYEGRLALEEIGVQARKFVSRYYAQFSKFDTISLDVPIFVDGKETRLDRLAAPMFEEM